VENRYVESEWIYLTGKRLHQSTDHHQYSAGAVSPFLPVLFDTRLFTACKFGSAVGGVDQSVKFFGENTNWLEDLQDISITAIFVASKIEETIKKLRDIFVVIHSVKHPDSKELDPEQVSEDRRRRIMGYEKLMLETLCFDFQIRHPYEIMVKFVKYINGWWIGIFLFA
jgi:hypothetical protein